MYEFASHCIDLAIYFFGKPDRVAGSILQSIYSAEVEDFVSSTFIYEDGYTGTITVNWSDESYRKPTNIITVFGTRGRIVADKHGYKVFLKESNQTDGYHEGWNTYAITDFAENVRFYVRGMSSPGSWTTSSKTSSRAVTRMWQALPRPSRPI